LPQKSRSQRLCRKVNRPKHFCPPENTCHVVSAAELIHSVCGTTQLRSTLFLTGHALDAQRRAIIYHKNLAALFEPIVDLTYHVHDTDTAALQLPDECDRWVLPSRSQIHLATVVLLNLTTRHVARHVKWMGYRIYYNRVTVRSYLEFWHTSGQHTSRIAHSRIQSI
jgi:hypothetical protein